MAKKIAQYQIDLEVLANSRDNLKEVQSKLETTDKIIKSLNDTGLKYFKNLVKEIDKIPQAISKADKALQLSTQTVKEAYTLKSGGIGFRNVRSSESRKATSEALGSLPDLKNFDAKTGLANDFNTITGKVTENIQKLNILKNVLKEVRDNYKNASGEAKKYWDYVEKNVSAKIGKIQNELHGGEKGFRDLRSFFKDMKDLASWQMRWYGAKAFLFTPMEIGAKTLKSYVSWEQAMKNASAVSEYTADDLEMLKKVTLDIGKTTSISAKEAAGALMEFAQAGIKAEVAAVALPLAAKMVIPTGEKMGVAVSALTTAFNAWKLSADDVPRVASEIGAAMADSKLKIADLSTVFNYLATVSADFNLSTKETLALTTLLSKAGVMPSTIGTGTRQTLTLMAKMPKRMKDMLNEAGKPYGWTAKDFSTDLNPPIEALKKLFTLIKDGVIGATELFKGFELRAGANVVALSRLFLEEWDKTLQVIGDPKWLDRAFKTSMGGIENQLKRTGNIIEAEIYPLLDKVGGRFAKILEAINDFEVRTGLIKSLLEVIVVLGAVKLLTLFPKFIAYLGTIIAKLGTINTMLGTLSAGWTIPVVVGVSLFLILKGIVGKGIEVEASEAGEAIKKLTTEQLDNVLKDLNEKVSKSGFQTEVTKQFYKDIGKWSLIQQPELGRQATIDLITRELSKRRGSPENMSQYEPSPAGKKESGQGKGMLGQQLALDKKDRNEAINLQKAYLSLQDAIWESSYKLGLMSSKDYFNKREEIAKESYNIMKKDAEEYLADFTNKNSKLYGEYQQQLADAEKIEDVKERAEKKAYIIQQFEVARKEGVRKLATLEIEESKRILKATQEMLEKEKDLYIKHQNTLLDIKKIRLEKEIEAEAARLERISISNEYAYSKGKISAEAYYNQEATKLNIERLSAIKKAENDYLSAKQKAANDFLYMETNEYAVMSEENYKQYNDAAEKALEERNKIVQNANDKQATSLLQLQIKKAEDIKAIYGSSGVSGVIGKAFEDLNTEWSNTGQHIYDTTKNIVTNMENSFADFFDYMSDNFMDFENLAKNVLHTIYMELLKNILLKQVLGGIFGSATGQGGLGSILSNLFPGRASGGSVSLNTPYIVGESGPELFVPNASGSIIPNNRLGTSSAPTLIVNVENKTGKQVKATQSQPQFDGKKWIRTVMLELANQDMSIRSKYGVR